MSATKSTSKTRKTREQKIQKSLDSQPVNIELAKTGLELSSLLWRKIITQVDPETKEMLLVHNELSCIWAQVAPDDNHRVPGTEANRGNLIKSVNKAERILTEAPHV